MKKILFLSLFISFNSFGQSKMEVVVGATENLNGFSINHKNPNCFSCTALKINSEASTGLSVDINEKVGSYTYGISAISKGSLSTAISGYSSFGDGLYGTSTYGTAVTGFCNNGTGSALGYAAYFHHADANGKALITGTGRVGIGTFSPAAIMDIKGSINNSHFYYGENEDTYIRGGKATSNVIIGDESTGNVGVGTSIPTDKLTVHTGTGYGISHTNGTATLSTYIDDTGGWLGTKSNHPLYFYSNGSGWQMVLNTNGRLGIGLGEPNNILDVNGRMRIRHNGLTSGVWMSNSTNSLSDADGAFHGMKNNTETGFYIGNAWRFWVNNAGNGTFTGTVTATGFPIASDFRYKKNIQPLENTLSKVQKIVGVSYDLRKDEFPEKNFSDKPQIGFIAQDIEKIFPEMVFTDEKGYKSVDYARLTPVLVEALKELTLKNQTLENKNQTLESRLDKIEAMLSTIQPNTENLNSKK